MPLSFVADVLANDPPPRPLASEADHRIANNLSLIAGVVRLQAANLPSQLTPATVRVLLEELSARVEAVGSLHKLLANTQDDEIDLGEYLKSVAAKTVSSLSLTTKSSLSVEVPDCLRAPAKQAIAMALFVQEAVANALKHAHPSGVNGKIVLVCETQPQHGRMIVEVWDDGVGLPEGFEPAASTSLGIRLMRALAAQLDGELEFDDTGLGLCVRLAVDR